jgi:hypothetical protein
MGLQVPPGVHLLQRPSDTERGVTFGPLILLKKKYKGDTSAAATGLIEHELTHARQFYRTCGLNGPRYLFARWRLAYEVEAYKV